MKCEYCGFSAFGKHKCLSCGAPCATHRGQEFGAQMNMQMADILCRQQMAAMQNQQAGFLGGCYGQGLQSANPFLGARIFG